MASANTRPLAPTAIFGCLFAHRKLIKSLVWREVLARYRGSIFGLLWMIILPLLMLAVYGLVFGGVFGSRWRTPVGRPDVPFVLVMFAGMVFVNMFTECLARAPGLMLENPAYIKRLVFPLEIMPWVALGTALFTVLPSLLVFAIAYAIMIHVPPWTAIFLPLVVAPLMLIALGAMWFIGALGVYLRDLKPIIGALVTALVFLSPLFFPIESFPENLRRWVYANPLTLPLQEIRKVLFWGELPEWPALAIYTAAAWCIAWAGYAWHTKTREGFADVV